MMARMIATCSQDGLDEGQDDSQRLDDGLKKGHGPLPGSGPKKGHHKGIGRQYNCPKGPYLIHFY